MALPFASVDNLLKEMVCGECGILFAMPCWYLDEKAKNHTSWMCPNGHSRYFPGKSNEEALKEVNERLRKRLDWKSAEAERLNNRLRGTRGAVTRIKRRVESGVCIYCKRHFHQLERHMKAKHKDTK